MREVLATLTELNEAGLGEFVAVCGPLFERSPWVAERAWPRRPFASLSALLGEMAAAVRAADTDEKIGLISAHPDLVGRMAGLSSLSAGEQAAAGLDSLTEEEVRLFQEYNGRYREAFGFPFVICARENRKEAILRAFPVRLGHTREQEIAAALEEVLRIAWLRLRDAVREE